VEIKHFRTSPEKFWIRRFSVIHIIFEKIKIKNRKKTNGFTHMLSFSHCERRSHFNTGTVHLYQHSCFDNNPRNPM